MGCGGFDGLLTGDHGRIRATSVHRVGVALEKLARMGYLIRCDVLAMTRSAP